MNLRLDPPARDQLGVFSEFRNGGQLFPESYTENVDYRAGVVLTAKELERARITKLTSVAQAQKSTPAPWPNAFPERLIWIVQGEAEPWLPTPGEQDAAFGRFLEARSEELAASRRAWREQHHAV